MNATKHGAFARVAPLYVEDDRGFSAFLSRLDTALHPSDEFEAVLVEKIALALWRSRRLRRYERALGETNLRIYKLSSQGKVTPEDLERRLALHSLPLPGNLDYLLRYSAHLDREWMRCYILLQERRVL